MYDLIFKSLFGFVILYGLFWCVWLQRYSFALQFARKNKEKKWSMPPNHENQIKSDGDILTSEIKTLYFVRHGESLWNWVFNRSKLPIFMIPRMIYSALLELSLISSGKQDSWFFDPPLSDKGFNDADSVRQFLKNGQTEHHSILKGESDQSSLLVCSNLKRCISTALVGFCERLKRTEEKVIVLHHLQEITTNPDGLSSTPAYQQPEPTFADKDRADPNMVKLYSMNLDPADNAGNKSPQVTGLERIFSFNEWLFAQSEPVVIVSGHSLWFKTYFKLFLPDSSSHIGKKNKIKNGGVVRLQIERLKLKTGETVHRIQESSIEAIHFGFK